MKPTPQAPRTHVDLTERLRSPAEVLRDDFMLPNAMTAASLARRTGIHAGMLCRILRGAPIKLDHAIRLAAVLNTTALYWLTLQARYELERITRVNQPQVLEVPDGPTARVAKKR